MLEFPTLSANDIEVRIQSVSQGKGYILLLYKTARVDANILDNHTEIGCFNWKKSFYELKGNIYCSLSIYDKERKEWVSKDDCGKESETESEKGEASDSFKRAGFAWGIGRELYTSPFIWVADTNASKENGRNMHFSVKTIGYTNKKPYTITQLEIINDRTKEIVYSFGANKPQTTTKSSENDTKTNYGKTREELIKSVTTQFDKLDDDKKTRWSNWLEKQGFGEFADFTQLPDSVLACMDKNLSK